MAGTIPSPADAKRERFHALHASGFFVLPNPWDIGSAKLLQHMGFQALATTSAGFAGTLGRMDMQVTREELVAHVAALSAAVELPLNVDAERCFADTPDGVAQTVEMLAQAGAAGVSIEDWNPATQAIDPVAVATERVCAAVQAADRAGLVLTARAENHLHGVQDLEDTIARLRAYRAAGAHAVYAPGITTAGQIGRVVSECGAPVNVLVMPNTPPVPALRELGVRRLSTGSWLAWVAYGALAEAAQELAGPGTAGFTARALPGAVRAKAFGAG